MLVKQFLHHGPFQGPFLVFMVQTKRKKKDNSNRIFDIYMICQYLYSKKKL